MGNYLYPQLPSNCDKSVVSGESTVCGRISVNSLSQQSSVNANLPQFTWSAPNLCRFRFLNRLHFTFSLNTAHVALRFTFWFDRFKSFLWRRWCTNRVAVIIIPVAFSFKYKKYYQYWAHHACVYLCYYSKTQWMGLTTWPVVLFFVVATNTCCWIDTDTHTDTQN